MEETRYTPEVGRKFHMDGSVRTFAGNTVISFVAATSHTYQLAKWVQDQVRQLPFSHKFALLPPSSFHMTVMELLCDEVRTSERWIASFPLDAPLIDTDAFFLNTIPQIDPPTEIQMQFAEMTRWSCAINVKPANALTARALRAYRDMIATKTGVRAPNHEQYQFHISLAYRLIELTDDEEAVLDTLLHTVEAHLHEKFGFFRPERPQLTFFDDMFRFATVDERHTLATR